MKYKITIIKYEKNDNYEAEMAKFKEKTGNMPYMNRYPDKNWDINEPQMEVAERSLEVFLTEEEYKKVKAEVIKIFE